MLLLTFRVAEDAYAVDAAKVVEVVPRVELRAIPHAPDFLIGLFHYRGAIAPVVDMGLLIGSAACRASLSTRIVLVEHPARDRPGALLGLLAEQVNDLSKISGQAEIFPAMHLPQAPYLGPIVRAGDILVQVIAVEHVLPESFREALFGDRPG